MRDTARRAFVATAVVVGVVALALALWKLRVLVGLILLAFVIAAAMRPGVDALRRRGIPRGIGVAVHYLVVAGLVAVFLWVVVPRAITQIGDAIGNVPTTRQELNRQAKHSKGIKHQILVAIQKRLKRLPSAGSLVHRSVGIGKTAFEILVGIFFTFASEREEDPHED